MCPVSGQRRCGGGSARPNSFSPCVPRKTGAYYGTMAAFSYRGREIQQQDILYIRALIERYPQDSRRKLSTRLCEAWQWRQSNGVLRDMVCRGLLLMLERAGQITLPPVSYVRHNPLASRVPPATAPIDTAAIEARLRNLQPLQLELVRRTPHEPLFN